MRLFHQIATLATLLLALDASLVVGSWVLASCAASDGGTARADAAVLFWGDQEVIRGGSLRTAAQGASLWKSGRVKALILVGGRRRDSEDSRMDGALLALGVPADAVHNGGRPSRDTISNLRQARDIAKSTDARTLLAVSDSLHMWRIRRLARFETPELQWASAAYPIWSTPPAPSLFWLWARPHREAAAWISYLLPESLRRRILHVLRPRSENDQSMAR